MNRNNESHFSNVPGIDIQRSMFDLSFTNKLTMNFSDIVPIYCQEVLAGDTFQVQTNMVARMQTLLNPVMDNAYIDTYFFYCPSRILWDHFKQFCGENTANAWIPTHEYSIPQLNAPSTADPETYPDRVGWKKGTIADYFGIPTNVQGFSVNALPFRGYAMIYDQYFRDQNVSQPAANYLGDSNRNGTSDGGFQNFYLGGQPAKACKAHDYFTSCLPSPQKGDPVEIPINQPPMPVLALDKIGTSKAYTSPTGVDVHKYNFKTDSAARFQSDMDPGRPSASYRFGTWGLDESTLNGSVYISGASGDMVHPMTPGNFWAVPGHNIPQTSPNITGDWNPTMDINQLRLSAQLQRYYERCARGGTRFREVIKSQFGVDIPDSRVQIPEYLGGSRIDLSIHEVVNTAESANPDSHLGNVGAMSVTVDQNNSFVKSFVEPGYIIGVAVARYDHSYSQGLEKMWTRKDFLDFYLPVFANIGEQPVYDYEIFCNKDTFDSKSVFGYNEAWADYRHRPNRVCAEMRPGIDNTLASWHFGDHYTEKPTLSESWMAETPVNVDRALSVTHSLADQIFADIYFKVTATRPMPMYSVPGLLDHN